jgi:hypothetical protein
MKRKSGKQFVGFELGNKIEKDVENFKKHAV